VVIGIEPAEERSVETLLRVDVETDHRLQTHE
jgi:hypothetical protein